MESITGTTLTGVRKGTDGLWIAVTAPTASMTLDTTASRYAIGCEVTNVADGKHYINTGTVAVPVWTLQTNESYLGYSSGASVTQITSRATGVTINSLGGSIQTDTSSLAAEASAVFVVTNNKVAIGDVVIVSIRSGMVALNTRVTVTAVAAGSFSISVVNGNAAAGIAETGAIVINFAVIKAVNA